eukprot:1160116-Pelagomonas_calceolata.AAC.2
MEEQWVYSACACEGEKCEPVVMLMAREGMLSKPSKEGVLILSRAITVRTTMELMVVSRVTNY